MTSQSKSLFVDPRLSEARTLMTQALQLLDEGAYHQPAAILDHALHALVELENTCITPLGKLV